jgi:hypothetical protein
MEEMYTPPISLTGFRGKSFDAFTPQGKESTLFVSETRPFDFKSSLEAKVFRKICVHGFVTKLTVHIPESQDHPFWKRSPRDLSDWDFDIPQLLFQVERWGLSERESFYHAVQRARHIIACIRMAVSGQLQIFRLLGVQLVSPLTIPQCSVLILGHELSAVWKLFHYSLTPWTINMLIALLQTKIDSVSHIQSRLLLQYYQVYPKYYCVNGRLTSTGNWESSTM